MPLENPSDRREQGSFGAVDQNRELLLGHRQVVRPPHERPVTHERLRRNLGLKLHGHRVELGQVGGEGLGKRLGAPEVHLIEKGGRDRHLGGLREGAVPDLHGCLVEALRSRMDQGARVAAP
ncbi:hypothetical protein D3C87_989150 [compost metagenome]